MSLVNLDLWIDLDGLIHLSTGERRPATETEKQIWYALPLALRVRAKSKGEAKILAILKP